MARISAGRLRGRYSSHGHPDPEVREQSDDLRAASQYARNLIEASLDPLVTISSDGKITDVNKATEGITGIRRDRLIGTDFSDYFTEPELARAGYRRAFDHGFVRDYPLAIRHASGSVTYVVYNATVFRDQHGHVAGVIATARDVSEQKRTAEKAKQLAAIVESSDDAISSKSLDGTILTWNRGAERLYGYSAEEAVGRHIAILAPPGQQEEMAAILDKIRRGERIDHYETARLRKGGSTVFVSLTVSPLSGEDGEVVGASTITRDITERKREEQRGQRQADRVGTLLELHEWGAERTDHELFAYALDKAVSLTDSSIGFFHRISEDLNTVDLTLWNQEALKGCTEVYDRHHPMELAGNWTDCVRQKRPVVYNDFSDSPNQKGLPKGHSPVRRFMSVPVMEGDRVTLVFGVGNKVEEYSRDDVDNLQLVASEVQKVMLQRQAQASLKESERRYRDIFDNVLDGLYLLEVTEDGRFRTIAVNPALKRVTGVQRSQSVGKTQEEIVPEEVAHLVNEKYRHCVEEGRLIEEEIELDLPGGRRLFQSTLIPTRNESGRVYRIIGISRDITERREAETALLTAENELRRTVSRLNAALDGTVRVMSTLVETRDPYTSGHERRVTDLAVAIAGELDLDRATVESVRLAARVHDIGKIAVPAEILTKPTRLSPTEFALIRQHPVVAHDILAPIDFDSPVAQIVAQHHERLDGSGYPEGLKGEELLLEARIIAVADVVEAMASHRPYRAALGLDAALDEVRGGAGTLFDPDVVAACVNLFEAGFGLPE